MNAVLIPLFVGMVVGSGLIYFLVRPRHAKQVAHAEPAKFSEKEAEGILRNAGFEVIAKQQRKTVITVVNGKDHFGYVEADYIVRRGKNKYLVMVKAGEGAADPNEPVLRRRFLEYEQVFSPDGLLLLDVNQGEIHSVSFRFPREGSLDIIFKFLMAFLVISFVIGIIWLLAALKLI
jgi:hypothetical protein